MNRKALSPLIATVLLIAFAVALGAVVMNWSKTQLAPGEKPPTVGQQQESCGDVVIKIEKIGDVPSICMHDGKTLKFMLENTGKAKIKKIKATVIGTQGEPFNGDIPYSAIPPAEIKKFNFDPPPEIGQIVKLKLTPVIMGAERDEYCMNQTIETTTVNVCG